MKKNALLLIVMFIITINFSYAQVTLPNFEPFNYPAGDTLPMHGWTGLNGGDQILVTAGSLNYNGLFASTGNKISFDGSGRDFQKTITAQTTGTTYMSFIMQVTSLGTLGTTGGYFIGFASNTTTFGAKTWIRLSGTGVNLGLYPGPSGTTTTWDATVLNVNTPVFVVVSYELVTGTTNDIVKMWINPTTFGGTTPPAPTITITNAGTDLASIDRMFIRQDNPTNTPFIDLDEIRLGNAWAAVTPAAVGIKEITANENFQLIPNPSNGKFNILMTSGLNSNIEVKVYNSVGSIVFSQNNSTSNVAVDLSSLEKGIYFVQVRDNNSSVSTFRKLVIQ